MVSWAVRPITLPDFLSDFVAGQDVLARGGNDRFAQNCVRFYEFCRDNDLYVSYTIVPPQIDRTKPAHQQNPPDLYAGVVEERKDGIVIRGGQMLGTGTVYSDYVLLSTIHPMKAGDENYAISVADPVQRSRRKNLSATLLRARRKQYVRLSIVDPIR